MANFYHKIYGSCGHDKMIIHQLNIAFDDD